MIVAAFASIIAGCDSSSSSPAKDASKSSGDTPKSSVSSSTPAEQTNRNDAPVEESRNGNTAADVAAETPPRIDVDDKSLTVDEYVKLGVPRIDRPWIGLDMAAAAKVLADVAKQDPEQLPRRGSSKSGEVFERIVSEENLKSLQNRKTALPLRVASALQFTKAVGSISKLYLSAQVKQQARSDETTELMGLMLRIGVVMSDLHDEFKPPSNKKGPLAAVQGQGLEQLKAGLNTMVQGSLLSFSDLKDNKGDSVERALKVIDATFPVLIRRIPRESRKEVLAKLKEVSEKPQFAAQKESFQPVLDKIEKAIEEADNE